MGDSSIDVPLRRQAAALAFAHRPLRRADPGRFLIFGQGRTGSTLLGSLLSSHPQVYFADEVLYDHVHHPASWIEGGRRRHGDHVYGIHVKIYQLTPEHRITDVGGWLRRMHSDGWRIIFLRRENLLRHVLSNMLADARGSFHVYGQPVENPRLEVDVHALVTHMGLRRQNALDEARALTGLPYETVVYETDLLDADRWQPTADRLFSHLGLGAVPVTTTMNRTSSADLSQTVSNLDEIRAALAPLGWDHFLDAL